MNAHTLPTAAGKPGRVTMMTATLACLFSLLALAACSPPAAEEQDKNWADSADLIETSDRIFTARFIESKREIVELVNSETGAVSGEADVLYRQFEVLESIKGTSDTGDLLWIATEPGESGELVDGTGTVREFATEQTYVLFLKGRLRPLEYPVDFGTVLWTGNGEPSFAELSGNDLLFRSDRAYLDLLRSEQTERPVPASAAPFTLSMDELREASG